MGCAGKLAYISLNALIFQTEPRPWHQSEINQGNSFVQGGSTRTTSSLPFMSLLKEMPYLAIQIKAAGQSQRNQGDSLIQDLSGRNASPLIGEDFGGWEVDDGGDEAGGTIAWDELLLMFYYIIIAGCLVVADFVIIAIVLCRCCCNRERRTTAKSQTGGVDQE